MATHAAWSADSDTGQSMMRVWLAISAVWLMFWAAIGVVVLAAAGPVVPHFAQIHALCLLALAPPAVLLGAGLVCRLAFQAVARWIPTRPVNAQARHDAAAAASFRS